MTTTQNEYFAMFPGLWVKEIHHREQPDVRFKHEMLLTLNTQQGSLVWSTLPAFNTLMAQHLRVPLLQVRDCITLPTLMYKASANMTPYGLACESQIFDFFLPKPS